MVDCVYFEARGVPVAGFAVDSLLRSVGRAVLRAHGFPAFPIVEIASPFFESVAPSDAEFDRKMQVAVDTALRVLLTGKTS